MRSLTPLQPEWLGDCHASRKELRYDGKMDKAWAYKMVVRLLLSLRISYYKTLSRSLQESGARIISTFTRLYYIYIALRLSRLEKSRLDVGFTESPPVQRSHWQYKTDTGGRTHTTLGPEFILLAVLVPMLRNASFERQQLIIFVLYIVDGMTSYNISGFRDVCNWDALDTSTELCFLQDVRSDDRKTLSMVTHECLVTKCFKEFSKSFMIVSLQFDRRKMGVTNR